MKARDCFLSIPRQLAKENLVADMLTKGGHPLHYYLKDDNTVEMELILEQQASPVPIEVKAKKGATASLNKVLEFPDIQKGYKLSARNFGQDGKKISLPVYMAAFL